MQTITVTTNAALKALNLSYYTLCKLADALHAVDPRECLEHRLARPEVFGPLRGELTIDNLGNFVSFR